MQKIIQLLLLMMVFQSCDVVVDLEIEEHTPVLVLNSIVNPDSILTVHISHSLGAFEVGSISEVNDATVRLYENDVYLADAVYVDDEGYYEFEGVYPSSGRVYKIEAQHESYETVYAISTVPDHVLASVTDIDTVIRYQDESLIDYTLNMEFQFEDNSEQKNYYLLELFQVDEYGQYPIYLFSNETSFSSSMQNPNSEYVFWDDEVVFTDDLFNGDVKNIEIGFGSYYYSEGAGPENQIKFQFSSISEAYYLYKKSKSVSSSSDDFFGGEPVQIYTNVQNGLGVFVAKVTDEQVLE